MNSTVHKTNAAHEDSVPAVHASDLHHPHAKADEAAAPPLMQFQDYCFAYDDIPVLRHINLSICEGERVVLMGDNGCGKSTLLRAMNGLIFPAQGSYLFDGQAITPASMRNAVFSKSLHARVGFIFQDSDAQLFCSSVEDEIAFGPRQMGLGENEVEQRVSDACDLLGINDLRKRPPYHLSGGEQKKVAIACVLSMNPDVYCLDEPLNGLDRTTRLWLVDFLGLLAEAGKTLVIATHDQSLADEVASYFVYMGSEHAYTDRPHIHINQ